MVNYYELVKNNPDYFKQFSCKDLLFLNYDCPVKLKKVAKWSQYNYIYYVLTGKKILHTPERSLSLTAGSITFVKKGACIVEQFFEEPFCIVVSIIPDQFILAFIKDYVGGKCTALASSQTIIPVTADIRLNSFYQSILPYFAADAPVPEDILELKFKEMLLCMLHNPANEELLHYFLNLRDQSANPIAEIMEANYSYNLPLEVYAKLTNRSISSFKRDFQSLYNTSPGRWLIEKKLARAKKLLSDHTTNITQVAFESGFENAAHFSRLFKQKTGLSPLQYRKHHHEIRLLAN